MKREARSELRRYVTGAALSAAFTVLAFWAVMGSSLPRMTALWVVGLSAIAQIAVQLRFFLHIGWRQKREDLQLILFSLLLLGLMIGGTIWIMSSLASRM
ncbi:cytochrome C oxidase subunit IV family protein [Roseovarius sp. SCSIO 43702]|uniref:cytochrome o ubiquinol oxidase subunit IV n=1 Tax=Roseovarius sp. SCSIO 43702 TaxID=2823043 RepID=UPI001C735B20|nr:cytochrome C oxidase subunit IV family protein [Roseovarius sp. SCSIO 43702]QYX56004.1 cytochrome C oxidase subunit IV family protein [Roseovarius sp. SCSIO 43702]